MFNKLQLIGRDGRVLAEYPVNLQEMNVEEFSRIAKECALDDKGLTKEDLKDVQFSLVA